MRRKMQVAAILAMAWVCAGFPVEAQHPEMLAAEHPELPDDTDPVRPSPKEVIPVPVVPDKMAVPAPTVRDTIKKPGERPAVQLPDPHTIPEAERKDVTPPVPTPAR
jgi:hypothetical protein